MTFSINNLAFTVNMETKTVDIHETGNVCVNTTFPFDHYNAEDCDTAAEVKEMIEEWLEETA